MQQNFIYNFLQGNTQKEIYKSTKKNLTVNNILYNLPYLVTFWKALDMMSL